MIVEKLKNDSPRASGAGKVFNYIRNGVGCVKHISQKVLSSFFASKKITLNEKKISTSHPLPVMLKFMQDKSYLTAGESTPSESFEIDAFKVALREVLSAAGHKVGTRAALACEHSFLKGALTVRPELIEGCPILAISLMSSRSIL